MQPFGAVLDDMTGNAHGVTATASFYMSGVNNIIAIRPSPAAGTIMQAASCNCGHTRLLVKSMKHFNFPEKFHALHDKALRQYTAGQRGVQSYFSADELAFLTANGLTAQNLFDYAEDLHNQGEPSYDQALAIELVRRDYFLNIQLGRPSAQILDVDTMPAKTEAVLGIEWLPRLIPKAKAKLRGELPSTLMYCCGGDRRFFQEHDIHPAEFLSLVWRQENNDAAIVDWVVKRSKAK